MIRLGLIGDNIKRSRSPLLHRLAGQLTGLDVTYESLIPADLGIGFESVFSNCPAAGFRGVNITYPYKEAVFRRLRVDDPRVRAIGACNTVLFEAGEAIGWNTDYTGFIRAFGEAFPDTRPETVMMAGAGGVGRAIAFALAELGARELRLVDQDQDRAQKLAVALREAVPAMKVGLASTIGDMAKGCDGLVNATPLGMSGIPGTAIPKSVMAGRRWAFDAVYTPVETQFLLEARAVGLQTISGYELFFHQGVDAFRLFTGHDVDVGELRKALASAAREAA